MEGEHAEVFRKGLCLLVGIDMFGGNCLGVVACELGVLIESIDVLLEHRCCLTFISTLRLVCEKQGHLLGN